MRARAASPNLEPKRPLGRIVSVSGSQAVVLMHPADPVDNGPVTPAEMGTLLKVETPDSIVLGLVSALTVPVPSQDPTEPEMKIIELEFVGELPRDETGTPLAFRRGISSYPALGYEVFHVSNKVLAMTYASDKDSSVKIGSIVQEPSIPAMVKTDDLLGKHLAVLGATGAGKSCSVALLLRNMLAKAPNAHIVLLDPHREYGSALGKKAEIIDSDSLNLPFWLLTFEEIAEILIGNQTGRDADVETLRELIPVAKARYGINQRRGDLRNTLAKEDDDPRAPTIDTPIPYRISDLVGLLDEAIGKLDLRGELAPFKRLKSRIENVSRDPRYAFMFGNLTVQDTMASVLSRIFRIPVNGKPVTIIELAGLPSEVINVVVSVLSRMTFDFALWSNGQVPITLICEEAHRYMPANSRLGFEPAKRALSKIAKEGRKYGVSLCIVSQRPGELDPTILSQCATMFCMRLANERDQEIVRARVSDGSASLLDVLPSLGTQEAVAFGEGVALPTRIRFDALPPEAMPRGTTARFSEDWQRDIGDANFIRDVVARWRAQSRDVEAATVGPQAEHIANEPAEPQPERPVFEEPAAPAPAPVPAFTPSKPPQAPVTAPSVRQTSEPRPAATASGRPAAEPPAPPPIPKKKPSFGAATPHGKVTPPMDAPQPKPRKPTEETVSAPAAAPVSAATRPATPPAAMAPKLAPPSQADVTKSAVEMARAALASRAEAESAKGGGKPAADKPSGPDQAKGTGGFPGFRPTV